MDKFRRSEGESIEVNIKATSAGGVVVMPFLAAKLG